MNYTLTESRLRRARQRIFDFEGSPKSDKAQRILEKLKARRLGQLPAESISARRYADMLLRIG